MWFSCRPACESANEAMLGQEMTGGFAAISEAVLHARMPSPHVWLYCNSFALPHFPNQEPPSAQQLNFPDLRGPHSAHPEVPGGAVVFVDAVVSVGA